MVANFGHGDSVEDHIEDVYHDDVVDPVSDGRHAADEGVDVKPASDGRHAADEGLDIKPVSICQEVVASMAKSQSKVVLLLY